MAHDDNDGDRELNELLAQLAEHLETTSSLRIVAEARDRAGELTDAERMALRYLYDGMTDLAIAMTPVPDYVDLEHLT